MQADLNQWRTVELWLLPPWNLTRHSGSVQCRFVWFHHCYWNYGSNGTWIPDLSGFLWPKNDLDLIGDSPSRRTLPVELRRCSAMHAGKNLAVGWAISDHWILSAPRLRSVSEGKTKKTAHLTVSVYSKCIALWAPILLCTWQSPNLEHFASFQQRFDAVRRPRCPQTGSKQTAACCKPVFFRPVNLLHQN